MYYMLSLMQMLQDFLSGILGTDAKGTLLTNLVVVGVTVVLFWIMYVIIFRIFRRLSARVMKEDSQVRPFRIQKQEILSSDEVAVLLTRILTVISWLLRLMIIFGFINTLLGLFSTSERLALRIAQVVKDIVGGMWSAFIDYLPNLVTAVIIILVARFVIRICKLVFDGFERQRIKVPGFYPEWSQTSFQLVRLMIIAMTIVVVFPYLPGSGSPAFQGVSIFFGVLLSLGSTTAVANVVAGVVITYTRAFRKGDWIQISDIEGKVVERTFFVTRIRTTKNVEVSIPNAAVMADKVINFSTQAKNVGIALHTSVTIGYDVPWPKVQELLLKAALATDHIERDPPPFVLQTSLDDNYVAYQLNAFTRDVGLRPRIYSELHANILDSFHSEGVEITSPHYRAIRDGNEAAMAEPVPPPRSPADLLPDS